MKFFKTEVDPLHYIEGIVASGWISGLQVFKNYFKVISMYIQPINEIILSDFECLTDLSDELHFYAFQTPNKYTRRSFYDLMMSECSTNYVFG